MYLHLLWQKSRADRAVTSARWKLWRNRHVSCLLPKPLRPGQTDSLFRAYVPRKLVFLEDQSLSENSRSALSSYQNARADHLEDSCVPMVLGNLRTEDHPTQPTVTLWHTPVLRRRIMKHYKSSVWLTAPRTSPESSNWLLIGYSGAQTILLFHGRPTWDEWKYVIWLFELHKRDILEH